MQPDRVRSVRVRWEVGVSIHKDPRLHKQSTEMKRAKETIPFARWVMKKGPFSYMSGNAEE